MPLLPSPLQALREQYLSNATNPSAELKTALAQANRNTLRNVYLTQDAAWSRQEAVALRPEDINTQPLWGVPVSLKDCFDLAGFPTSCGSNFYRDHNGNAAKDSTVASRLRDAGAIITGKTHLHQLAYGITGENRDFGDCTQPLHPEQLTGGSSSGAAASVQEGSAIAAIGTDTGGSIRVPAGLCGLAGYRSSITLNTPELWEGGAHLCGLFDTVGWLYRDLRDGPQLANTLFNLPSASSPDLHSLRVGIPEAAFLRDCEPAVLGTLHTWQRQLAAQGAQFYTFDATPWDESLSIYTPILAHEASLIHQGYFRHFEPIIAERLAWGAGISEAELAEWHRKLSAFRGAMTQLFERFDYLLLPCAPMAQLQANSDHAQNRPRILRYTTPISLAGLPVVTLPGGPGGLQLVGRLNADSELLSLSAQLAETAATIAAPHSIDVP